MDIGHILVPRISNTKLAKKCAAKNVQEYNDEKYKHETSLRISVEKQRGIEISYHITSSAMCRPTMCCGSVFGFLPAF